MIINQFHMIFLPPMNREDNCCDANSKVLQVNVAHAFGLPHPQTSSMTLHLKLTETERTHQLDNTYAVNSTQNKKHEGRKNLYYLMLEI